MNHRVCFITSSALRNKGLSGWQMAPSEFRFKLQRRDTGSSDRWFGRRLPFVTAVGGAVHLVIDQRPTDSMGPNVDVSSTLSYGLHVFE